MNIRAHSEHVSLWVVLLSFLVWSNTHCMPRDNANKFSVYIDALFLMIRTVIKSFIYVKNLGQILAAEATLVVFVTLHVAKASWVLITLLYSNVFARSSFALALSHRLCQPVCFGSAGCPECLSACLVL